MSLANDFNETPDTQCKHAWFSKERASTHGYAIYKDLSGKQVKVTNASADPCLYQDLLKDKYHDISYVGVVRECVNTYKKNPPPQECA